MSKKNLILLTFLCLSLFCKGQAIDTICMAARNQVYSVENTPGSKYYWFIEGGVIKANNNNSIIVDWKPRPGLYTIRVVEITKYGCVGDTVNAQVIISAGMHMLISGPSDICLGDPVVLTASGAAYYKWSTGQTSASIVVKPDKTTTYDVLGYDGKCYQDTLHITVHVHAKPHADFSYSPAKPILNENVNFFANAIGASSYKWYFEEEPGNVTYSKDSNTVHAFQKGGHKLVTLVVTNPAGCSDTMRYRLFIDDEVNIYVPNAFTPNGDGLNDTFNVVCNSVQNFNLEIFNRWGERVFQSDDIHKGWDGTFHGTRVQMDAYYWQMSLQGGNDKWYYMNGTITVVR